MNSSSVTSGAATRGEKLYEGKAKVVYRIPERSGALWIEYKDSLTAFNALKKGSFASKGPINRDITSLIFRYLEKHGVKTHRLEDQGANVMLCKELKMIPLEVVVRNVLAGSLAKRLGREEGALLPTPIVEFYFKDDALQDPFINDDQALFLSAAKDKGELQKLKSLALQVNDALREFFSTIGIRLVDFKLEFGRDQMGEIILGDEITPDSCRLWDKDTNDKLDKDRFRRDLGKVEESYREVLNRIAKVWGGKV